MKPNIILIVSDQHNASVLGASSDSYIKTPNLDKLSKAGVTYENCYCPAPLCSPSRVSLLSGQYPHNHEVLTNQKSFSSSIPTVAHSLGIAGYESVLVGRMDFREYDQFHGYEKHLTGDITSMIPGLDNLGDILGDLKRTLPQSLEAVLKAGPGTTACVDFDDKVAETTRNYLKNRDDSRPLFLTVGFFSPHNPYICHEDLFNYYDELLEEETVDYEEPEFDKEFKRLRKIDGLKPHEVKKAKAAYYGLVEYLDTKIGQIIESANETLDMTKTVIIYLSDHGDSIGKRGLFYKSHLYEDSVRVPLIISAPDQRKKGHRDSRLVSLVDIAPTIIGYADGKQLPLADGVNIGGIDSASDNEFAERVIFSELGIAKGLGPSAMARKGDYKYIYYHDEKFDNQLFDLKRDPEEMTNLLKTEGYEAIADELRTSLLNEWNPVEIDKICRRDKQNFKLMREWSASALIPVEDNSVDRWKKDL